MTADVPRRRHELRSRRDLLCLTGSAAAGAAGALSGCGDGEEGARAREEPNPERDVAVLGPLLDQEHAALAAYRAIVPMLDGAARSLALQYPEYERQHGARLAAAIRDLGGSPPGRQPARAYVAGFPPLRGRDDALRFAVDVEETAVAAYLDAMAKLSTAALRAEAAAIVTIEAEQLSVLRGELGLDPISAPFVGGEPASI